MQAENLDYNYLPLNVMQVEPCQVTHKGWKLITPSYDNGNGIWRY